MSGFRRIGALINCLSSKELCLRLGCRHFKLTRGLPPPLDSRPSYTQHHIYTIQGRYICTYIYIRSLHRFSIIFLLSELFPCLHNDDDDVASAIGRIGSSFCFITLNKRGRQSHRGGNGRGSRGAALWLVPLLVAF